MSFAFVPFIKQILVIGISLFTAGAGAGAVPELLSYQGRIAVGGMAFDGPGQFKFALVDSIAAQAYWSSANDGNGDGQPDGFVTLNVFKGLYSVHLGDTNLANMAALPAGVFTNDGIFLRVWFNDGTNGFQHLAPDQRVVPAAYAFVAATVPDGAITSAKLETNLASQIEAAATAGLTVVSAEAQDTNLLARGFVPFNSLPAPPWVNGTTTDAASPRYGHSAVWTGTEWVVWGGNIGSGAYSGMGGRYQPDADVWTAISSVNAPAPRGGHTAVWNGTEMIVWGGFSSGGYLNSGGLYLPNQQQWSAVSLTGAPEPREGHTAAWTGERMVVWGGRDNASLFDNGALYDPETDQWLALNLTGAPSARYNATAVWTGNRLIIWGGIDAFGESGSGGQLLVTSGTTPTAWQTLSVVNAPSARRGHSAVWTGQKMIVWGGQQGSVLFADGAAYDPALNTWTALSATGAPSARSGHCAVWSGTEMLVLGGETASGPTASGAAYNPANGKWRSLNNGGNPVARSGGTSAWTGSEWLLFGGRANGQPLGALQRLNPQPAWHLYRKL